MCSKYLFINDNMSIIRLAFALLLVLGALCLRAHAQTYPVKPVRIVVPYVAGGATDIYARVVGKGLSEELGQNFIVENRPGAATIIGAQAVAQAPKDGYTLLFTVSATLSANPHLYKQLPYKFEDFAPVGLAGQSQGWTLSIHPSIPAKSVPQFVAFAKARPGSVVLGSLGAGSGPFLVGKTFERLAALQFTEVSYKGSAEAMRDLMAGHIGMYCEGIAGALAQHKACASAQGWLHIAFHRIGYVVGESASLQATAVQVRGLCAGRLGRAKSGLDAIDPPFNTGEERAAICCVCEGAARQRAYSGHFRRAFRAGDRQHAQAPCFVLR